MQSVSTQVVFSLLFLAFPLIVGVVVFVLARRTRHAGLWWLFLALGVWPVIATVARYAIPAVVAVRSSPGNMTIYILGVSAALALVSMVLQIAACVKVAQTQTVPPAEPLCPRCGYNVTGLPEDRCPECGTRFVCETRYLTRAV